MSEPADSIVPVRRSVTLTDGREVSVRPFRIFGDMEALQEHLPRLGPFFGEIAEGRFLNALAQAGDPCLRLTALATRLPADELSGMDGDDQVALVLATFEVNADFFGQRLTPALTRVLSLLTTPIARGESSSHRPFQDMTATPPAGPEAPLPTPPPA